MDPQLTNEDVADILALLDSLPYDELDLETPRFRLTLRRTPAGWTQSTQVLPTPARSGQGSGEASGSAGEVGTGEARSAGRAAPPGEGTHGADEAGITSGAAGHVGGDAGPDVGGDAGPDVGGDAGRDIIGDAGGDVGGDGELVAVRAPLPGTFYRAPRPGAAPFVEVGSRVGADTVIGIVETMKLMNSVHAGVAGMVAEFCVANAEFAAQGAALLRIRADQ
jgi:acetyl-CoA carboxylase biotin carboxyl carrier protein